MNELLHNDIDDEDGFDPELAAAENAENLRQLHQAGLELKYKYPRPECDYKRFAHDTADHQMTILHFEPPYVHLMFSKPKTNNYRFDLISAPGQMIVTGDMGSWIFSRERDMWNFFKTSPKMDEKYLFDPHYWLEKADAIDRQGGERFSFEYLIAFIVERMGEDDRLSEDQKDELLDGLEAYRHESLHECLEFLDGVEVTTESGRSYRPFAQPEGSAKVYTFGFLWICYAIAWGVKQYHLAFTEAKEVTDAV